MTLSTRTFAYLRDGITDLAAARELENLMAIGQIGTIFYYDPPDGNDDNSGLRPDDAKKTLNAAIGLCIANRGDVIICMRGTETVTETVEFDVSGITVIPETMGINPGVMGEFNALLADSSFTDGPVATITAPCVIVGMGFASRDAGTTFFSGAACLIGGLASASPFGVRMHQCRFPKWGLTNRIGLAIEGSSDVLIDECTFEGVGSDFESGIYLQGAAANIAIRNNVFRDCDYALTLGAFAGGGPHLDFHGNRIIGPTTKGVDTGANTGEGLISGNFFNTAVGSGTFDRALSNLETDGWIISGNNYAAEAPGP